MANCPKCGRKLHLTDWKPECPDCHVNMNYYKANERLLADSEAAEIEHAKSQPGIDRAKAATIGTKTGKIRMAMFLIPIAALFLPLCSITVAGAKKNYNAIDIYNLFTSLDVGKLLGNITPILIAIICVAIPAVCCIVFTIMQLGACSEKGLKRNIVLSSVSLFLVAVSLVCTCIFSASPAKSYTDILLYEADFAVNGGSQENVDKVVKKLRALHKDSTVDTAILEKAISDGEKTLASAADYGLDESEISVLKQSLEDGKAVLADSSSDIDAVRDAASAINSAGFTYSKLQDVIYAADKEVQNSEDGAYSDESYREILSETKNIEKYLQNSVFRAKLIENDGRYSENSFANLQTSVETAQGYIDTLGKGELIVDPTDGGSGKKTDKAIARETANTLLEAYRGINDGMCGLVDISSATQLIEKTDSGNIGADVSASFGIGLIVLIILYVVQLIFNIKVSKKGIEVKYTKCLIGGIPSDEYFKMVDDGVSELEIRKRMVVELTKMQDEVRAKEKQAEEDAMKKKMERK